MWKGGSPGRGNRVTYFYIERIVMAFVSFIPALKVRDAVLAAPSVITVYPATERSEVLLQEHLAS